MLRTGQNAPNFTLPDQDGNQISLNDFLGKWVLVYFYPKDDTPGCTKEACGLRDNALKYEKDDIIVLGISKDTPSSHKKFISKYKLPFTLLSDTKKEIIKKYDADKGIGTKRISYLINPDGIIEKIYDKVKPETHAEEVLKDIEILK